MAIKKEILSHFKAFRNAVLAVNGRAFLDVQDFCVEVRIGYSNFLLYPQFVTFVDGQKRYTANFSNDVVRFCGWRPYKKRAIALFAQKLELKRIVQENKLPTPEYSTDPNAELRDVLVKKSISSFGDTIKGPYRSSLSHRLQAQEGEYYEKFIEGKIIKAWFWNEQPVCLEQHEMARVVGDGGSPVLELALRRTRGMKYGGNPEGIKDTVVFHGKYLDTVLGKDEPLVIDFRYGSKFAEPGSILDIDLASDKDDQITAQLTVLGRLLWGLIPDHLREDITFTVDGILDQENRFWFLEANANPIIHPYIYPRMLASLRSRVDVDQWYRQFRYQDTIYANRR